MTLRPADREEIQIAWMWAVAMAAALVLRPLWLAVAPALPACPFRSVTGLPCPTCGTTHAAVAMLHLHFGSAFYANPLAAAAGVIFVLGGILAPVWAIFIRMMPAVPQPLPITVRAAMVAAIVANWAWVIFTTR